VRAFVTRVATTLDTDRARLPQLAADSDERALSQYATTLGMPPAGGEPTNILFASAPGTFDSVVIGISVQLFAEPWGRAFLRHCCRLIKPGGVLALPIVGDKQAVAQGTWSAERLTAFLSPQRIETSAGYAIITDPKPQEASESILDWFSQSASSALVVDILARYVKTAGDFGKGSEVMERLSYPGQLAAEPEGTLERFALFIATQIDEEIARATKAQAYYVSGIGSKAAVVKHIIRSHLPDRHDLRLIDFGGGYGLLMAELLLDPELSVRDVVVQDIQEQNRVSALQIFSRHAAQLEGRFRFAKGRAEDFVFTQSFDVISFLQILLYVPREQQPLLLRRCWDALNPGGVLIVQENLRSPQYVRDMKYQFDSIELDQLMGEFGEIRRYLSNARKEISKDAAEEKTIYRVIQKTA
jgi:2-polyprenyl-3-methyl-5-hydroxy-6-metoxy-1,4-benzoquinol methylase